MDLVHILSPEDIEDPHATLQNKWGVEGNFELFIVIALFHDRLCSCIAVQPDHVQGLGATIIQDKTKMVGCDICPSHACRPNSDLPRGTLKMPIPCFMHLSLANSLVA